MQTADAKISKEEFLEIQSGKKKFILLKDNSNIQVGCMLFLWENEKKEITGRFLAKPVKYVMRNAMGKGLAVGYCIIGF